MAGSLLDRLASLRDDRALSVFADELVQAGDIRGEYLALVRSVARLPAWERRWADATFERRRIQAQVQRAWRESGALDDLPGPMQVSLASGLPTRLNGPAASLAYSRSFPLVQAIRSLDVTTVSADLVMLERLPWLEQLRDLFLFGGPAYGDSVETQDADLLRLLTSPRLAGLRRLSCQLPHSFSGRILLRSPFLQQLEHLDLFPSQAARVMDPAALLAGGPLPLEELVLRNASLTYDAVRALKLNFAALTRLRLEGTSLSAAGLGPLADGLPRLQHLELVQVDTDWEKLAALFETGFAPQLQSLEIGLLKRSAAGGFARFITALASRPIARLRLTGVGLAVGEVHALTQSGLVAKLAVLQLESNLIGDLAVKFLADTPAPKLRALSLFASGLPPVAADHLAEASWLPQLHALDLRQNELGAPAFLSGQVLELRALRMSGSWGSLTSRALPRLVSLDPPQVGVAALLAGIAPPIDVLEIEGATEPLLVALAGCPHARSLRKLVLKNPQVTDAAIFALVESEHLANVLDFNLRYPQLTQKSERAVNARFGFPQFAASDPWRE